MSHHGGIRWFRGGLDRWACAVVVANLGLLFGVPFLVAGIAHAEVPEAVAGAVVLFVPELSAYGFLRAGIGVTGTDLLIRSAFGSTRAVPWQDVTGFAVTGSGRTRAFSVLGQGGRRWNTVGCSPSAWNRQEEELARWRLARALEDERLARNPGTASDVPSCPPEPVRASWGRRWGMRLFIDTMLAAFLGLAVWLTWSAAPTSAWRSAPPTGRALSQESLPCALYASRPLSRSVCPVWGCGSHTK
jgi:hypothetical protein